MNILIIAPRGKMGSLLVQVAAERKEFCIAGGVAPKGRDYIGQDIGLVAGLGEAIGSFVYDDIEAVIGRCDGIMDFSTCETSMTVLRAAKAHKKALVLGTTGFSDVETKEIEEAASDIPIVFTSNTSELVNLMYALLETTARAVGSEADIEIIEMHDRDKLDAPSGTSKEMGRAITKALSERLEDVAVYGRSSLRGDAVRTPGSIGYHSVRSGNISSSHTVMFGFMGERLEITHHAYDWLGCAKGACDAMLYLEGKKNGMYQFRDILGLN